MNTQVTDNPLPTADCNDILTTPDHLPREPLDVLTAPSTREVEARSGVGGQSPTTEMWYISV